MVMEKQPSDRNGIFVYDIFSDEDTNSIRTLGIALSSSVRLKILYLLREGPKTLYALQQLTGLSATSINMHIKKLEAAKLIHLEYSPNKKGGYQLVFLCFARAEIFSKGCNMIPDKKSLTVSMPIGLFTEAISYSTYFRLTTDDPNDRPDVPISIFSPKRSRAGIIYTDGGKISYTFAKENFKNKNISGILLSLEICSECPYYSNTWKSNITFYLNGVELCTYESPGDYGDRPGKCSPAFWKSVLATQYGQLVKIFINAEGTFLNDKLQSNVSLNHLKIDGENNLIFTIETKRDCEFYGGFNIFGKNFGDYPQDIELTIYYNS